MLKRCILLLFLILGMAPVAAHAERPIIPAVMVSEPPVLDGDLSDPCWQEAASVTDFHFPADGTDAAEPTTAWLCYDQKGVYIAFYCRDSQTDKIVAQQKKRGGDIGTDDWVGVDLDCHCLSQSYGIVWFDVSAGGVQVENLQSGDVSKIEWKGDWSSAAKRVDDGYAVEMAIPFSILHYDPTRTSMGIAFIRRHARLDQWWWAPDIGKNEDPKNFYLWEGLKLPRPKTKPLAMAYGLFGTGEADAPKRMGLDVKHAFTPNLTGVLTLNPDFRNVEQAVDSVDFTYTERWLPDSRPFFLEGGRYHPSDALFYSRRVGEIDYGAKVTGRIGEVQLGALHCGNFGEQEYSILHLCREWPSKGNVRMSLVQSEIPGRENTATHISAGYRIYDKKDLKMHLAARLWGADAASGHGGGQMTDFSFFNSGRTRVLSWEIRHRSIDSDFDPLLGYVPEKGIEGWSIWTAWWDEPSEGKVSYRRFSISTDLMDNMDGSLYQDAVNANYSLDWRNGTGTWLNVRASHRPPYHDRTFGTGYNWGGRDLYGRGGFGVSIGKKAGGDYLSLGVGQGWSINDRINLYTNYEYSRIERPSPYAYSAGQLIASLAYDLDTERTMGGRLVSTEGKSNLYLTFKQRVRSGTDIWFIFGDPNAESTRSSLLLKLIRTM